MNEFPQQKRGSALLELLRTSLPAAIDLSIQPLIWTYEAIWIGRLGIAALGGHGLAVQVIIVVFTVMLTFVVGSSLIINRHLGRGNSWEANHILGQSMMLGIIMALASVALFYFGAPLFFKIIKEAEPAARVAGIQYLRTLGYFMPFIMTNFIALGIIRGVGDSHYSMMINIVLSSINLVIAPMLIFGTPPFPRLEITGAAVAAGIAHTIGLIATIILLRSRKCKLFLSMREMTTPNWKSIKLLFNRGLPTTVELLAVALGQLVVSIWVARIGVVALATHQILLRLQAVMSMIYQGFGLSSMALVGKKVGADEHLLAERTGKIAGGTVLFIVLVMVAVVTANSDLILKAFTPDPAIWELGSVVIVIFALVQIPKALNTVLTGNLRGAGELKFLMWTMLAAVLIFEITTSAVVIFVFHFALTAVWLVHGSNESIRLLCNYLRFRNGKWKLHDA
ncbi:MATE family efflux transporter [candidate division KSB1 bacterium]